MNSLSWLIYLAGAVSDLEGLMYIGLLISVVGAMFTAMAADMSYSGKAPELTRRWKRMLLIAAPLFAIGIVVLPTYKTIMFIAASEFAEQSVEAQVIGSKSYKALDKFLSDYLEEKQ